MSRLKLKSLTLLQTFGTQRIWTTDAFPCDNGSNSRSSCSSHQITSVDLKHWKSIKWLIFYNCHQINRSHVTVCVEYKKKWNCNAVRCLSTVFVLFFKFRNRFWRAHETGKRTPSNENSTPYGYTAEEMNTIDTSPHTHSNQYRLLFSFVRQRKNVKKKKRKEYAQVTALLNCYVNVIILGEFRFFFRSHSDRIRERNCSLFFAFSASVIIFFRHC